MSPDPITVTGARTEDPQQLNLYSYVRNNPLIHLDPTGMIIDDSQLSDKDKKKWQGVQNIASEKDANGNLLHPKLNSLINTLQSDSRTFTLQNSALDPSTAGRFTITQFTADGKDFTNATVQLDFKKIAGISGTTAADLVPNFNKYEGLLDSPLYKLAETFGHEFAHGVFAVNDPAQGTNIQHLLDQRDQAMHGAHYPYPPDVMQKMDAASRSLIPTERYAQQMEKIVHGEMMEDHQKKQ